MSLWLHGCEERENRREYDTGGYLMSKETREIKVSGFVIPVAETKDGMQEAMNNALDGSECCYCDGGKLYEVKGEADRTWRCDICQFKLEYVKKGRE